jgi:hypothetical protein
MPLVGFCPSEFGLIVAFLQDGSERTGEGASRPDPSGALRDQKAWLIIWWRLLPHVHRVHLQVGKRSRDLSQDWIVSFVAAGRARHLLGFEPRQCLFESRLEVANADARWDDDPPLMPK